MSFSCRSGPPARSRRDTKGERELRGRAEGPPLHGRAEGPPLHRGRTEGPPLHGRAEGPPLHGRAEGPPLHRGAGRRAAPTPWGEPKGHPYTRADRRAAPTPWGGPKGRPYTRAGRRAAPTRSLHDQLYRGTPRGSRSGVDCNGVGPGRGSTSGRLVAAAAAAATCLQSHRAQDRRQE